MIFVFLILTLVISVAIWGYFYIQKINKEFNKKADLLEKKIIGGYNMDFAAYEFKQLKRMAFNSKNQERLYQLRRLFVAMYGDFIE